MQVGQTYVDAMTSTGAHISGLGCRNSNNTSLATAGLILLYWAFLFLPQLRLCQSSLDANQHIHLKSSYHDRQLFVMFAPRKLLRVVQRQQVSRSSNVATALSPLLPPDKSQFMNGDRSEVVYEDDKRRVHTGPNPLHN